MAEAGPSSPSGTQPTPVHAISPSTSFSKQARIHFPHDNPDAGHYTSKGPNSHSQLPTWGLGRPRRMTQKDSNGPVSRPADARPRVQSVDSNSHRAGPSRLYRAEQLGIDFPVRNRRSRKDKGRAVAEHPDMAGTFTTTAFSDEFDLDPGVLEDVQRALRLKARREARHRSLQPNLSTFHQVTPTSDIASGSSLSPRVSPVRPHYPASPPLLPTSLDGVEEPDIDFSPSVAVTSVHPVPRSAGDGIFDWTGSGSEDEKPDKKWSLSIKRRIKEKPSQPLRKGLDKQGSEYAAKLKEIKSKAQQNTLRKAEITSDQLRRRYTVLHPSGDQVAPTNILQVSRWFSKQKEEFKSIVYKEEPLTWLKHLLDKRSSSHPRSRWQLSALIMEEYEKSKAQPDGMETIPEGVAVEGARTKVSPPSSIGQQLGNRSPSTGSRSWTSPRHSIEPSLSRRRATADGLVSFEPLVDSGRDSIADVRISEDIPLKGRAHSPQDGANSPRSSIHSGILNSNWPSAPSSSSRLQFRELAQRLRRKPYAASDEALSSERNSVSEQSLDEDGPLSRTAAKARANRLIRAHSPSAFISDEERKLPLNPPEIGDAALSSGGEGPATAKQGVSPYTSRPAQPNQANLKVPGRLVTRLSTPNLTSKRSLMSSPYPLTSKERDRYRFQEDEERERKDYERKAQLLEDAVAQNVRIRQVLHCVGTNIREYEDVQSGLSKLLGVPYVRISSEVLEALSHDPAAVTTKTRMFASWRAVEDIYARVVRQRETLRAFADSLPMQSTLATSRSVFEDPIKSLMQSLEQLEIHRRHITRESEAVAGILNRVKNVHSKVKKGYNETLSHTSLVYPELSQIIALEESYRNHYQQVSNLALDALTLLLDTVTPFWRNYGKVIGVDAQDFLIIPWYRNEFTGEPKRYPIKTFPCRSLRHWLGLLVLYVLSAVVTFLQIRGAISSTLNYNLPWITHTGFRWMFIPVFIIIIIIQWIAAFFESCILVAELGVVVWWMGWSVKIFD